MTTDVRLAFAPGATYARLVQDRTSGHAGALLARLALAVAIIGTSVASAATGRVSLALVASVGASWSFALLVQVLAAAAIIVPARSRRVTTLRAFELWFRAHLPWTLWLLLPPLIFVATGTQVPDTVIFGTALVPVAWTVVVVRAFARHVLATRRVATAAAVQQAIVWGCTIAYIAYAIGGWDRVLTEVGL